jgi:hypothetical protein
MTRAEYATPAQMAGSERLSRRENDEGCRGGVFGRPSEVAVQAGVDAYEEKWEYSVQARTDQRGTRMFPRGYTVSVRCVEC